MRVPDPWKVLARTDLILHRAAIAEAGRYYHRERVVVVRAGLLLREERSVLWHELVHARRGDARCAVDVLTARQEASVDREAARWAMPWPVLAWGLDRSAHLSDLVEAMKVTEQLVRVRLKTAHPVEKAHIMRRAEDLGVAA